MVAVTVQFHVLLHQCQICLYNTTLLSLIIVGGQENVRADQSIRRHVLFAMSMYVGVAGLSESIRIEYLILH